MKTTNLLKLAIVAGFMTGAAAHADQHEKHDAKDAAHAEGEKEKCATCKGEKKAKAIAEKKAKGEGCGEHTCAQEKKAAPKKK